MIFVLGIAYMLVMGAVLVSMAVLLLKGKKARYNFMYLICQGMVALWCCSQILILLSQTDGELALSYLIGNFGICFVGSSWYYFALMYTGKQTSIVGMYFPFAVSLIQYLLVLTNKFHHLYYVCFSVERVEHGVFFFTNVGMTYLFVILGAVIIYRNLERENKRAKQLIVASVFVPVVLNLIYVTGFIKTSFDITPLGFGISGIFVLLATIKYRFMEVNITAFDVILSGLEDGVGIFNQYGKLTYSNQSFYALLPLQQSENEIEMIRAEDVLKCLDTLEKEDASVFRDAKGRYLQIQLYQSVQKTLAVRNGTHSDREKEKMSAWATFSEKMGFGIEVTSDAEQEEQMKVIDLSEFEQGQNVVFVVKDMSRYYALLHQTRELAITNERLALEKERNRIAQQVHDTAGHTLTMIQSYMKLAAVSVEKQEMDKVEEYLLQARSLTSDGIRELRESINQLRREASYELVTQGIMQLAAQVKEIPVEVTVQGEDSERYSHLSRVLYDSARESITNALKYSEASKIDMIVRFQQDSVELVICDDGKGCGNVEENNGIRGIRERVKEAEGTVRFITAIGEGFLTRIKVPV